MAVQFILGRAGTGKSQWCFDRILDSLRASPLGPTIFWIVPRQATFQAERLLACAGGMGGYFRARIVSFDDLAREILMECGGASAGEISDIGRRMILGHLLRKHQPRLKFFQGVAHQPGVAAEIDATFAEFQRCNQTAQEIAGAMHQPGEGLSAKLHDLALLHKAYEEFLGQDRLDPERRAAQARAAIERCSSLRQAEVYVDGFYDFSRHERQILVGLARACPALNITLTIDPKSDCILDPHPNLDELSLFHKTQEAYRRLWFTFSEADIAVRKPLLLDKPSRFARAELAAVEDWEGSGAPQAEGAIRLVAAPDRRAEVDAAARWVKELVAGGARYRDIAVLMRGEEDYRDLIDASFREHGIPFFADRRRTAAYHPLLRLIRAALAVAKQNFSHDSMMAVLKTGLVGLNPSETDALENYVLLHGIAHDVWISPTPWTGNRQLFAETDEQHQAPVPSQAQTADATRRRVIDRLLPFVHAVSGQTPSATPGENRLPVTPVRDYADAVFKLLEAFHVRSQIIKWMQRAEEQSRLEERGEHERVWKELVKLFDELVDLFGDERITLDDFIAIIDSALEGFDLALAPPTVDQVLVGQVDRTRTPPLAACAILGLCEGQFPQVSREGTVFSDADRRALSVQKIDLDPDTQRRLLDEIFWGYIAFTRASRHLLLIRSIADAKGQPTAPSSLWLHIQKRFPAVAIEAAPREDEMSTANIATPRQLICALIRWVRAGGNQDSPWASIYHWLATRALKSDAIDTVRHRAWKALSETAMAHLSPQAAAGLFASPINVTISQLETFAACPFQHFARYGLGLSPRVQREVGGADLSQVYHDVLDRLVRDLIQNKKTWVDLDEVALGRALATLTAQLGKQLRDELMLSTARNRYLLDRIERTLHSVAAAQRATAERGGFQAAFTNVRFGELKPKPSSPAYPPLAIRTPRGNEVMVRGKIDRVDIMPDGSACVIDYRLATQPLDNARAFHGLSLQMLTYLLVLEKNGRHLTKAGSLTPAAALCVQLLRSAKDANPQDALSPDDPAFNLRVKPRGIFDLRYASQLDNQLTKGSTSEVVNIFVKQDGELGRPGASDAVLSDDFTALLAHVGRRIAELADRIVAGEIGIRPSRLSRWTPCSKCQFHAMCRFEPAPGGYVELTTMNREEMLKRVMEGD
ncbi:MAG: PD-(D/E)XK nuclease family protein [Planctomycetota bacterium]|nr:PD-(D/E)XK nuclease family protein [Planctomycetota bacterium]